MEKLTENVTTRISKSAADQLARLSDDTERSQAWLVRKAIQDLLERCLKKL